MAINWKNPFKKKESVKETNTTVTQDFYDIEPINNTNAVYRIIMGQRSNRQNV